MEEIEQYDKYWQPRKRVAESLVKKALLKRIRRGLRNLRNKEKGAYRES